MYAVARRSYKQPVNDVLRDSAVPGHMSIDFHRKAPFREDLQDWAEPERRSTILDQTSTLVAHESKRTELRIIRAESIANL